ncbi:histone-lysine N-methyltransferase SETDB2 isoform X2 [Anarrhichthys ocellatus]|uniref:histone-lysine N-methyltransferase SETDB2 isoform X2 n=1 Tax=Anarrhichthys ocellatus TaxID=433405 RepID=UPI0012EE7125|nr:histone-lysine N-methyltransferase SETDB2-like isoform X2 [Anarrhichthys ocellatus]
MLTSVSVMEMEENLDPREVERAKAFWSEEDVDQVFSGVFEYLDHLKKVLKKNTATDKEYVQGLKLLESLNGPPVSSQDSSVVQVVIGSDELFPADSSPSNGTSSSAAPPSGREELLPPLTPVQLQYEPHSCCKACLPSLPSMPQCTPAFWGQNPLKVPLLCGFKRLSAVPLMMSLRGGEDEEGAEPNEPEDEEDWDVLYKAPCGQSLRNHEDVMRFLLATESYDVLQVDFFTFNASVQLDPPPQAGPRCPEMDLSRGLEPTPVQLCVGDGGARPAEFRYRKDRWPHGCFLTRGPALFHVCCDCTDGCADVRRCACAAVTGGGQRYDHHRLPDPVPSGVYECGPWCGCVRTRCQNRLVQRGIRVRLQVFQTDGRGWGVRCRDDLDRGTFVCVYAGVTLQRSQSPAEPSPPKLTRSDLPSDDEVEVVTEWLPPPVLEGRSTVLEPPRPTSPTPHVPVIQRPNDAATPQDRDQTVLVGAPEPPSPPPDESGDLSPPPEKEVSVNGVETRRNLKRAKETVKDVYFLDASKEGNVSRFLNHSCQPNLFVQNVFTDSHDPGFPVVAFFTSRVVKAGTELTWNYSADSQSKQEVPCLCSSSGCQGRFTIENQLCEVCEVRGQGDTQ